MSDDIEIKASADLGELKAELALAKAEFANFQTTVDEVAASMLKMGESAQASMLPVLSEMVDKASAAEARINSLKRQINEMSQGMMEVTPAKTFWKDFNDGVYTSENQSKSAKASFQAFVKEGLVPTEEEVRKTAGVLGGLNLATSGAIQEYVRMSRAIATGQWSRLPSEFATLASRTGGLADVFSGLTLRVVGAGIAAAGLVTTIGILTYREIEAINATNELKTAADFSGNFDISRKAIDETITSLDRMSGVTRADADEIVGHFARIRDTTVGDMRVMSEASVLLAHEQGTTAKQAAVELTDVLKQETFTVKELQDKFVGATAAEIEAYLKVQETGSAHEVAAAKMNLVADALDRGKKSFAEQSASVVYSIKNWLLYSLTAESGIGADEIRKELIDKTTAAVDKNTAAIRANAEAKKTEPLTFDETLRAADRAADATDRYATQITVTQHHIDELRAGITALGNNPGFDGAAAKMKEYQRDLEVAIGDLARLKQEQSKRADLPVQISGAEAIGRAREAISEINADQERSASERLQAIQTVWQNILDGERLTATQRQQVVEAMNKSIAQAEVAVGNERISNARTEISEINASETKGSAERLAEITAVWARVLESDKLTARQRAEVERDFNNEVGAVLRKAKSDRDLIGRETAASDIEISKINFTQKRDLLEEEVREDKITEAQKLTALRQLAAEQLTINLMMLDQEVQTYHLDGNAFELVELQKRKLRAETAAEIAKLDEQIAANAQKTAEADIRSHRQEVSELTSAEHTMISGIIGGRQTMNQILLRTGLNFLEKELEADATYATQRLLLSQKDQIAENTMKQAGLLWHILFESKKTAATAAGESARLAEHETAQTAAATADVAMGSAQILNDAYKAAAGAYSAVAGIPYVGPFLAPVAAGVAFAAVAAFDSLTALEVGAWEIPRTMPALLHPGESVVPKDFASGLRENIRSGSPLGAGLGDSLAGSTTTGSQEVHLHFSPIVHAPATPDVMGQLQTHSRDFVRWIETLVRDRTLQVIKP